MRQFIYTLTLITLLFPLLVSAKTIHSERSLYRNISVDDDGDLRCLKFHTKQQKSQQSCIYKSDPKKLVFSYTKLLMSSLLLNSSPKNILIIGLGGGTLSNTFHQLYPQINITNVELDDAVIKVARQYFDYVENKQIKTITQDGRIFVKRAALKHQQYDLIILDAFNGDYIPEHLMTKEFLQEVKKTLTPNGVLAANTFSSSQLYAHESATYQAVFGDFYNVRNGKYSNRIILALTHPISTKALKSKLIQNNMQLKQKLMAFDVNSDKLLRKMKVDKNWRDDTRLLTDQYSPANLLNVQ
jgi:spermidine synthase